MKLHRELQSESPDYLKVIRAFTGARLGRLGMLAPWNQLRH